MDYLIYATANKSTYADDFLNFLLMIKKHPGVSLVQILVVVSEIQSKSKYDEEVIRILKKEIEKHSHLNLLDVIFKSNIGRDFSSVKVGLEYLSKIVEGQATIMVRNRSCFGPFMSNWYLVYKELLESNSNIAMVGNTINFSGLPDSKTDGPLTHIQTYVYMTPWSYISNLIEDFPGQNEVTWESIVNKGEIGLSQKALHNGYSIACLLWPDRLFNLQTSRAPELPQSDIKALVKDLPFLHRKNRSKRWFRLFKIVWFFIRIRVSVFLVLRHNK